MFVWSFTFGRQISSVMMSTIIKITTNKQLTLFILWSFCYSCPRFIPSWRMWVLCYNVFCWLNILNPKLLLFFQFSTLIKLFCSCGPFWRLFSGISELSSFPLKEFEIDPLQVCFLGLTSFLLISHLCK